MGVKDFRELRVYELAFDCAVRIYEMSERFPSVERYSLTDQIRRAPFAPTSQKPGANGDTLTTSLAS